MKKSIFYIVGLATILVASCQEKEEPIPTNLIGTWEYIGVGPEFQSINRYIFRAGGTFSNEWADQEVGGTEDIGYQQIRNGNFRASENEIIFTQQEILFPPFDLRRPPFAPREEMERQDFTVGAQDNSRYSISEDGNELTFLDSHGNRDEVSFKKVPL